MPPFTQNLKDICTLCIMLAGKVNMVYDETIQYPFNSFLSDIGGAAGLFLGLNVIGFVSTRIDHSLIS